MNDKKVLAAAVKAIGEHSLARIVWARYPLLERISTAYAKYIGSESVDADGKPLLETVLKHAFAELGQHPDDDDAARAAFINAVLSYSSDVFAQLAIVDTPSGEVQWMPFACGLMDFMASHPGSAVTVTRRESAFNADMARMFVMMKILPSSLLDETSLNELLHPAPQVA